VVSRFVEFSDVTVPRCEHADISVHVLDEKPSRAAVVFVIRELVVSVPWSERWGDPRCVRPQEKERGEGAVTNVELSFYVSLRGLQELRFPVAPVPHRRSTPVVFSAHHTIRE
jgi:hypothetical protein